MQSGKEDRQGEKKSEDRQELPKPLHLSLITLDHPDFQSTMAAASVLSSNVAHAIFLFCPALAQNHTGKGILEYIFSTFLFT